MSFKPQHAVVWTEIPVTDMARAMKFYSDVFHYQMSVDDSGPNPVSFLPTADQDGIAGHLYPGTPSSDGPTVHLLVPDTLAETSARLKAAGGTIVSDPITIPPGTFAYARDPDGNNIGLFEAA